MKEFESVDEFLDEATLNEKEKIGRKGEFIGIYASKTYDNQGLVSAEVVDNYSLHGYKSLYLKKKISTRPTEIGTRFLAMFSISSKLGNTITEVSTNFTFRGNSFLKNLKLTPPVVWSVDRMYSRTEDQTTLEIVLEDFVN